MYTNTRASFRTRGITGDAGMEDTSVAIVDEDMRIISWDASFGCDVSHQVESHGFRLASQHATEHLRTFG